MPEEIITGANKNPFLGLTNAQDEPKTSLILVLPCFQRMGFFFFEILAYLVAWCLRRCKLHYLLKAWKPSTPGSHAVPVPAILRVDS